MGKNKERPCSKDIAVYSFVMKSLWNQFSRSEIQNALLVQELEIFEKDSVQSGTGRKTFQQIWMEIPSNLTVSQL